MVYLELYKYYVRSELRSSFELLKVKLYKNFVPNKINNKNKKKTKKNKKKDVMKKMAQAITKNQTEEKIATIDSQVLFHFQAPEVLKPQVLDKEAAIEKLESQSIKKKLKKMFNKVKYNAKITEEVKCINNVNANLDAKILAYRNNLIKF